MIGQGDVSGRRKDEGRASSKAEYSSGHPLTLLGRYDADDEAAIRNSAASNDGSSFDKFLLGKSAGVAHDRAELFRE